MRLRPLDAAGVQAYLDEIPPRLLTLRIDAGRLRLRWWLPMWAIEEPLRFALRLYRLIGPLLPRTVRDALARDPRVPARLLARAGARDSLFAAIDAWFSENDRDLLAMPDDVPFVDIDAGGTRVRLQQTRLLAGVRKETP